MESWYQWVDKGLTDRYPFGGKIELTSLKDVLLDTYPVFFEKNTGGKIDLSRFSAHVTLTYFDCL